MSAIETPIRAGLPTGTWKVDPIHSKVGFAVKHLGVSTVRGEFRDFDGTLEVDEEGTARAYGTVKAASVTTNQDQRDEHLRSADFFEVDEHPELLFESTRIEQADEDTFKVVGDLTLHGVTREIELDAELGGRRPRGRRARRPRRHRSALAQGPRDAVQRGARRRQRRLRQGQARPRHRGDQAVVGDQPPARSFRAGGGSPRPAAGLAKPPPNLSCVEQDHALALRERPAQVDPLTRLPDRLEFLDELGATLATLPGPTAR